MAIGAQNVVAEQLQAETKELEWKERIKAFAAKAVMVGSLAAAAFAGQEVVASDEALAFEKRATACGKGIFDVRPQQTCVTGTMGKKDFANHREWIESITVGTPNGAAGSAVLYEVWGDGFYKSTRNPDGGAWSINKHLRSGTNVCGAATDKSGFRDIACFAIKV